ncbi:Hypothetical protein HVR_LOCUS743 [uncultured virus]|nr:Hypothetical protein HVR_LOCUS743 [uncultured virus]
MTQSLKLLDLPENLRTSVWEIYDPDSFIDLRIIIPQLQRSIIEAMFETHLTIIKKDDGYAQADSLSNLIFRFILINQVNVQPSNIMELRDFDLLTILEYPTSLIGMILDWKGYDLSLIESLCEFITPDISPEDGFKQVKEITKELSEREKKLKDSLTQASKDISVSSLRNISKDTIEFQKKKESLVKVVNLLHDFQREYQPVVDWRNRLWSQKDIGTALEDIIDSHSEIFESELVRAILLWSLKTNQYNKLYERFWCRFGFEKAMKIYRIITHRSKLRNFPTSQSSNVCFIAGTTWDEYLKYAANGKCLTPIVWTANQWISFNKL